MARRLTPAVTLLAISLIAACSGPSTPLTPTVVNPAVNTPPAPVAPNFPPVDRPARIYNFAGSVSPTGSGSGNLTWYTVASRFVLFDDKTFVLQYPHVEYRGTYTQQGSALVFGWEGWSSAGPWGATGTIVEDSLTVHYNTVMMLSDFEDARYKLGN